MKLCLRIGLEGDDSGRVRKVTEVRKPIWETSAVLNEANRNHKKRAFLRDHGR